MEAMYRYLGLSKQAVHQQEKRDKVKIEVILKVKEKVKSAREEHPRLGSRRLHRTARIEEMGITRFEELMSREGMTIGRKRRWMKTTDSRGKKHIYANLTNGIKILGINELVVGDMTYLQKGKSTYYLLLLTDVYSLRIVGWEASQDKSSCHAEAALEKLIALRGGENLKRMIHHTDRGSEYRSDDYIARLQDFEMQISMAKSCIENGYAERVNGLVKNDYLDYMKWNNLKELRRSMELTIDRLNRLHRESLEDRSPLEYETWVKTLRKEERPVLEMYNFNQESSKKGGQVSTTKLVEANQIVRSDEVLELNQQDPKGIRGSKKPNRYRLSENLI
jgi:transposase InsO family protein